MMTPMSETTLRELMAKQKILMSNLGLPKVVSLGDPLLRDTLLMIVEEVGEIYRELPTLSKPWRPQDNMARTRAEGEAVDLLFFILELYLLMGLSAEEVASIYHRKYEELKLRLERKNAGKEG